MLGPFRARDARLRFDKDAPRRFTTTSHANIPSAPVLARRSVPCRHGRLPGRVRPAQCRRGFRRVRARIEPRQELHGSQDRQHEEHFAFLRLARNRRPRGAGKPGRGIAVAQRREHAGQAFLLDGRARDRGGWCRGASMKRLYSPEEESRPLAAPGASSQWEARRSTLRRVYGFKSSSTALSNCLSSPVATDW